MLKLMYGKSNGVPQLKVLAIHCHVPSVPMTVCPRGDCGHFLRGRNEQSQSVQFVKRTLSILMLTSSQILNYTFYYTD